MTRAPRALAHSTDLSTVQRFLHDWMDVRCAELRRDLEREARVRAHAAAVLLDHAAMGDSDLLEAIPAVDALLEVVEGLASAARGQFAIAMR